MSERVQAALQRLDQRIAERLSGMPSERQLGQRIGARWSGIRDEGTRTPFVVATQETRAALAEAYEALEPFATVSSEAGHLHEDIDGWSTTAQDCVYCRAARLLDGEHAEGKP